VLQSCPAREQLMLGHVALFSNGYKEIRGSRRQYENKQMH
jgi:hypothetical protein